MTTDSFSKIDWTYYEALVWVMSRSVTVLNDVSEGLKKPGKITDIDLIIYHTYESLSGKRIHQIDIMDAAAEIIAAARAGRISIDGAKSGRGDLETIPAKAFIDMRFIEERREIILRKTDLFDQRASYWGNLVFNPQEVLKEWPPLPGTAKEDIPMPLRNKRPETWHWIQAMSWIAFNNPDPVIDGITVNAPREHSQYVGDTRVIIQHAIRQLVDAVCDGEIKPSDSPMDHGRIVRANPSLMTDRDRESMVETLVPYFIWGKTVCESSSGYTAPSSVRYFVDLRFRRQDILDIWPDDSGAALLERAHQVTDEPAAKDEKPVETRELTPTEKSAFDHACQHVRDVLAKDGERQSDRAIQKAIAPIMRIVPGTAKHHLAVVKRKLCGTPVDGVYPSLWDICQANQKATDNEGE